MEMQNKVLLSVVLPAFNEEAVIGISIQRINSILIELEVRSIKIDLNRARKLFRK
jgi:hypothetical protein